MRKIVKTMKLATDINTNFWKKYKTKEDWLKAKKEFDKGMKILTKRWFELWD